MVCRAQEPELYLYRFLNYLPFFENRMFALHEKQSPINNLRTLWLRDLILDMLIGHHQQMSPINFEVNGSKVKVSVTLSWKKQFPINNLRTLNLRDFILGRQVCHDQQMNPIGFEVSGSKVKVSVTLSWKKVFWLSMPISFKCPYRTKNMAPKGA